MRTIAYCYKLGHGKSQDVTALQLSRFGRGEGETELSVVLREALWAYIDYKRIPPNPRLGAMTIIPLTPPLKCNVNTMALHLKSGTKYMS